MENTNFEKLGFKVTIGKVTRLTLRKAGKLFMVTIKERKASAIIMGKSTKICENRRNESIDSFLLRLISTNVG